MLADQNTYLAYTENTLVGASPMRLVIALYEGAVDAVRQSTKCFETGDIMGRGAAITKATNILSELIFSLDMEKGGEISLNLKKLYSYMQQRLLSAHMQKNVASLTEVEGLLMQLLEAWNTVASEPAQEAAQSTTSLQIEDYGELIVESKEEEVTYTGYFLESSSSVLGHAYSF
jgi:flagellar protein FliS